MGAVDIVGLGHSIRLPKENGELTTSAGGDNLLAPDGRVVDVGGLLNVVDSALAGLVVAGEAPGVGFSIASDGKAIIRASGDGDDVGDACRRCQRWL